MEKKWWKEAFGYQIYPRSFNDSNNDGVGDLRGIIEKLDYLSDLGINLIWICPFYKSPMDDNGYDVSDYYDIDPLFGNLDDCKELIEKAHSKGIRIIADLVLNHTSDEHPWFVEAKSSNDNQYRDFYIWQSSKDEKEPNNWASFFGGSAWKLEETTGEYFMKIFSDKMPDLNWENSKMREEMYKMANWWLDLGIDGFRVDAVAHIARDTSFKDSTMELYNGYAPDWQKFSNLPDVHKHLKEFNEKVLANRDVMTVGEVGGGATPKQALEYVSDQAKEFNMVFNFDHNHCYTPLEGDHNQTKILELKKTFNKWQTGLQGKGWNALYWLNHDQPRLLSRYGHQGKYRLESAKMLANVMYFMWGTPFIYNGEEIGMTNYPFKEMSDFNDVAIHNSLKFALAEGITESEYVKDQAENTRDNARTPMQWDDSENGGFSAKAPILKVNPNYKEVNVKSQVNDENSILSYYKQVISLRTKSEYKDLICYGLYEQLNQSSKYIYSYQRSLNGQKLISISNMDVKAHSIKFNHQIEKLLLSNYEDLKIENNRLYLKPYESIVAIIK